MSNPAEINEISEYERLRNDNIQRNQEFLSSIGVEKSKKIKSLKRTADHPTILDNAPTRKSIRLSSIMVKKEDDRVTVKIEGEDRDDDVTVKIETHLDNDDADAETVKIQTKDKNKRSKVEPSSDSCRSKNANISVLLSKYLGTPFEGFGKAIVMERANNNILPKFSKLSGVSEWRNCVFLWMNFFPEEKQSKATFPNVFHSHGETVEWFGGSRMTQDSDIIQRILNSKFENVVDIPDNSTNSSVDDEVILFARLDGENYCCLGRVRWVSHNLNQHPVQFLFHLLDYPSLCKTEYFQKLLVLVPPTVNSR